MDKVTIYNKKYYMKNKEKCKLKSKQYYENNIDNKKL